MNQFNFQSLKTFRLMYQLQYSKSNKNCLYVKYLKLSDRVNFLSKILHSKCEQNRTNKKSFKIFNTTP